MIIVHHLDASRSQRILWLLEELGLPYEIKQHKRDPQTRLAWMSHTPADPHGNAAGSRRSGGVCAPADWRPDEVRGTRV